jgi:hypothetical protein
MKEKGEWPVASGKGGKKVISHQSSVTSDQWSVIRKEEKKVISLSYEARRAKWGDQVNSDQTMKSVEGRVTSGKANCR